MNARFPGSTHDAFIWSQSRVSETLERIYRQNPANTFFVIGDSGKLFLSVICRLLPRFHLNAKKTICFLQVIPQDHGY